MTVTIELTPEQEAEITRQAQESGLATDDYLNTLLQQTVSSHRAPAPPPAARPRYDRAALLNLLDELESNHEKYGTPEEQREALDHLREAIDAGRPGQRSVFGQGYNPA